MASAATLHKSHTHCLPEVTRLCAGTRFKSGVSTFP